MQQNDWGICAFLQAIGSRCYREIEKGNTVFVSMTGGGYVFDGVMVMLTMSKSRITTKRQRR
jgi:hypothetical protein